MIHATALMLFGGIPLVAYGGMLALLLLLCAALVGFLSYKGMLKIPFKWHPFLAGAAIIVAVIHAIFGLSILFNF